MHELAATEDMLQLVLAEAERAGASRVTAVQVLLGEFATVVEESLTFYWELLTQGTPAEGARLQFNRQAALARCRGCGRTYRPESRDRRCPDCGQAVPELLRGVEFRVEFIEIE